MKKGLVRKIKIFDSNIRKKLRKITKEKTFKYRVRYVALISFLLILGIGGFMAYASSFGLFESQSEVSLGLEAALFFIDEGTSVYDMNIDGIFPNGEENEYVFTVSNFKDDDVSQVDMTYTIELITTTNMPLEYKIYRESSNILGAKDLRQDEDGAWYNYFKSNNNYTFTHGVARTDTYRLVIVFPQSFSSTSVYAEQIDSIQIVVNSRQLLGSE